MRKMKKLKKVFGFMLAAVMVIAMCIPSLAATGINYTLTVEDDVDGYTYEAWQIFSGDLSEDESGNKVLSNVDWGSGVNGNALLQYLKDNGTAFDGCESAADVAAVLSGNSNLLDEFATAVDKNLTSVSTELVWNGSDGYTATLEEGYYFVKNTAVPEESGSYTEYIVQVVGDTTIANKRDIPTSDKTIDDINDSTETVYTNGTSADHDIGDQVPFHLSATLPDNAEDYVNSELQPQYKVTFHDTFTPANALELDVSSIVVKIDGNEVDPSNYTVLVGDETEDGCSFEVVFDDVLSLGAKNGSVITIDYTAELTENAIIGNDGQNNKMYIEYSDNPYNAAETDEGPETLVTVFTFELDVDKTNEAENPLYGAGFTLYKLNAETGEYEAVGDEIVGTDSYQFSWKGIDDGMYKIVETTVPSGYNQMDDIEFTVTATHTNTETGGLTSLVVTVTSGDAQFTTSTDDGTISTTVINESGTVLPGTGGIGTTIFYIVGAGIVLCAVVVLVTRRRMRRAA